MNSGNGWSRPRASVSRGPSACEASFMAEFDSGRVNAPADHTTSCFERGDGPWGALGALLRATPEAARQPAKQRWRRKRRLRAPLAAIFLVGASSLLADRSRVARTSDRGFFAARPAQA